MRFCGESVPESYKNCIGGQSAQAARQITDHLNTIPHKKYVEPFLGVGNVFRAKDKSEHEILNDKDCNRVSIAKARTCQWKSQDKCDRFKAAEVTCKKDYKELLAQHDSPDTLFYLDPPYHDKVKSQNYASTGTNIEFSDFANSVKHLKSKVAISYSDNEDFKKTFCSKDSEFRCHKIKKHYLENEYNEILAVKK